jgi:carboxyl-terminal processing protease
MVYFHEISTVLHENPIMNQKKLQVWLPIILSVALVTGMFFGYKLRDNMGSYGPSFFGKQKKTTLQEILEIVKAKYVDTVNVDSLGYFAIQNVLNQLDPHSVYIQADQLQSANEDLQGNFEGVGIEFDILNDTVTVFNLMPNGPAEKAGLQTGDQIISANDSIVSGVKADYKRIRKQFRGPKGSTVKVKLFRNSKVIELTIQRGVIPVKTIDAAYMLEPGVAFIRINKFAGTTYEEFMENLERLKKEGMTQLILDLRENGGGILDDAIQIADEFLDGSKEIVYTEGKSSPKQVYTARRPGMFEEGKLVVLIDEGSASASEVLTGALQDWDRATIIGRRSFGKGLVQEQFNLSDGSAVRLTISRYFTPIGRSIQKPYEKGNLISYKDEVLNRFSNGEVFTSDSAHHQGKAYKTKGGRIVYGNGGINPDVFVAIDSTERHLQKYNSETQNLVVSNVFHYFLLHKKELQQLKSPADLIRFVNDRPFNWQPFHTSLQDSNKVHKFTPAVQKLVQSEMIGLLGRQLWRTEGYFKIMNLSDPMVARSLEVLKK